MAGFDFSETLDLSFDAIAVDDTTASSIIVGNLNIDLAASEAPTLPSMDSLLVTSSGDASGGAPIEGQAGPSGFGNTVDGNASLANLDLAGMTRSGLAEPLGGMNHPMAFFAAVDPPMILTDADGAGALAPLDLVGQPLDLVYGDMV